MLRPNGPVLAMFAVLCAMSTAACEDDPDDLDYLKAGSGGNAATAGKAGSGCKCGEGCDLKCGPGGGSGGKSGSGAGSAGKAGASSDADAG